MHVSDISLPCLVEACADGSDMYGCGRRSVYDYSVRVPPLVRYVESLWRRRNSENWEVELRQIVELCARKRCQPWNQILEQVSQRFREF
jgi:hypothetical protein